MSEIFYNTLSDESEKIDQQIFYNPSVLKNSSLQIEITSAEQLKKGPAFLINLEDDWKKVWTIKR